MKKLNYLLVILFSLSLICFTACKNNDDDGDGINLTGNCSASWKVNGSDFSSDNMAFCIYLDSTLNLSTNTTGGDFFLQIDPITSTGTYTFDNSVLSDPSIVILLKQNAQTTIGPLNGTVIVTELSSSKAKGTFSGTFYDLADINLSPDFNVTEGTFEASF